jgi:hypothetical protein
VCDVAESCTGTGAACPADSVAGAFVECRPSAGPCDVAENCNGVAVACPADSFQPSTTVCRAAAGVCDLAENCTGSGAACPANGFQSSTTVCRPSGGVCDQGESCNGVSNACPADAKSTAVCRASAGVCDQAESCDGVSDACPADTKSTAVCRASAGFCDLIETCDGISNACPADAKSTAECRASAGACDPAESCDGVGNDCPANAIAGTTVECRPAAGDCDAAENCDGANVTCPADFFLPNGTSCDDGTSCTGPDSCQGGVCTGVANADACADDFLCYKVKAATTFASMSVSLADQFESATASVRKVKHLCTPGDKNGEGVFDTTTHLVAYQIKSDIKHVRRTNVLIENQISTLRVDTTKADLLLVPSNKDLTVDPPAPDLNAINVDHYKCYKIKVTSGTPRLPKGITVSVEDQFASPAKVFELKKPKHLCAPVDKNGEGIKNPDAHLLCYSVKATSGQPKHVRQSGLHVNNQLGVAVLGTTKEAELCIPSIKTLGP